MEKEFLELVNNNRALIYKVCNLYCDSQENRRDLFQEVILQLWKSFPRFRGESSVGTWLYKVALNTAISNFRKDLKNPGNQPISLPELDIPDISEPMAEKENKDMLTLAMEKLTEVERAIILLYLEEKTYEEMSEIMAISVNNVGVRLTRIKNKLSKIIKTV